MKIPLIDHFSKYFMVLTEILINKLPRITHQGDGKSDIFWVNSKFWTTFRTLECIFQKRVTIWSIKVNIQCISAFYTKSDRERNSGNALRSLSLPVLAVLKLRPLLWNVAKKSFWYIYKPVVFNDKPITRTRHPTNRFFNNAICTVA